MNRIHIAILRLAPLTVAATSFGCSWMPPPHWSAPGPAGYQQNLAETYDPYPENDIGPPVVGARPPSFENPIAEPARARRIYHYYW